MDLDTAQRLMDQNNWPAALSAFRELLADASGRMAKSDAVLASSILEWGYYAQQIAFIQYVQGDYRASLEGYGHALKALQSLETLDHLPTRAILSSLAHLHDAIGNVYKAQEDAGLALESYCTALNILKNTPGNEGEALETAEKMSSIHVKIGGVLSAEGDHQLAIESYMSAVAPHMGAFERGETNTNWDMQVCFSLFTLAEQLVASGDPQAAFGSYCYARDILDRNRSGRPGVFDFEHDAALARERIGDLLRSSGDAANAMQTYEDAAQIGAQVLSSDSRAPLLRRLRSVVLNKIGDMYASGGNHDEADRRYQAALAIKLGLTEGDATNAMYQRDLWQTHNRIADNWLARGEAAKGLASYKLAHVIFERLTKSDPGNAQDQRDLLTSYLKMGTLLKEMKQSAEANKLLQTGGALASALSAVSPDADIWRQYKAAFDEEIDGIAH